MGVVRGIVVARLIDRVAWPALLYAMLCLTVVRMPPVFLCLVDTRTRTAEKLLIGRFGRRGLATIVLAVFVLDERCPITTRQCSRPAGPSYSVSSLMASPRTRW
jgi:NhaP-type Na+/H+ and K+/H+ antiporter